MNYRQREYEMLKKILRRVWPISAEGSRREFAEIANEIKAARKEVSDGVNAVRSLERQFKEMKERMLNIENALVVDGIETRREVAMRVGGLTDAICRKPGQLETDEI